MHVYERTYGKIERMFRLPDNAEDEKIEAHMKNGVLTVHIPKTPEEAKEEVPERPSRSSERRRATATATKRSPRDGGEIRERDPRHVRARHAHHASTRRRTLPVSVRKRNPDAARARLSDDASLVSQTNLVAVTTHPSRSILATFASVCARVPPFTPTPPWTGAWT